MLKNLIVLLVLFFTPLLATAQQNNDCSDYLANRTEDITEAAGLLADANMLNLGETYLGLKIIRDRYVSTTPPECAADLHRYTIQQLNYNMDVLALGFLLDEETAETVITAIGDEMTAIRELTAAELERLAE